MYLHFPSIFHLYKLFIKLASSYHKHEKASDVSSKIENAEEFYVNQDPQGKSSGNDTDYRPKAAHFLKAKQKLGKTVE